MVNRHLVRNSFKLRVKILEAASNAFLSGDIFMTQLV